MIGRLLMIACVAGTGAVAQRIVLDTDVVLDGRGGTLRNQQIVVNGTKIEAVAPGKAAASYDLRGLTVMPGWIDTHVHLNWHFDAAHKYNEDTLTRRSIPTLARYTMTCTRSPTR